MLANCKGRRKSGLWVDERYGEEISPAVRRYMDVQGVLASGTHATSEGETSASHTPAGGAEHQVVMIADADGQIHDSRPEYMAWFPPATNAASRSWADLFNADAVVVVRVRGIWIVPTSTAITGVNIGADINKTSTVGTGGTAVTPRPCDSSMPALDADVTARAGATGGATLNFLYWSTYHFNEETIASTQLIQHQNQIPSGIGSRVAELVLRQNQGIQVKQHAAGTVGLTGVLIYFVFDN